MTMLKLRCRPTQTQASRRRLAGIPSAAFLLLRGVSGRDSSTSNTPVHWTQFADEIGDRITQKVEHANVATLTAITVPKEQASLTQRSLANTTINDIPDPLPLPTQLRTKYIGNNGSPASGFPLGECEGDCDRNRDCAGDLICHQRSAHEAVPGCDGGKDDSSDTDYCIRPTATIGGDKQNLAATTSTTTGSPTPIPAPTSPRPSPLPTPIPTKNPSGYLNYKKVERIKNLKECEGDCDRNSDCVGDLICFQRKNGGDPLPGCEGTPNAGTDFCIRPEFTPEPTRKPTRRPTPRPTRKPTRTPTMAPTFMPIPGGEPAAMIKMYWQRGYFWQDSTRQEWYCLQCKNGGWDRRSGCEVGMKIEIDDCRRGRDRQQFVRVEGDKTIRPAMSPELCISHQNHADFAETDGLTLEYCNGGRQQQFDIVGTRWQKYGKFEIRTSLTSNRQPTCWTNAHHPRPHEEIFPQRCDRARRHETASWTAY